MKKHLLISFISFNLLLSQANAFTPEEMAQAEKSLLKPHQLKISRPIFLYNEIEAEAQRLHDIAMQKLHEQEMRDLEIQLEIQKEKAINNLCSQGYSKEDAIARINVEGFDVVDFNKKCEAERVRQAEELEAIRAESVRLAEEWAAENARLAEEWAAESARLAEESAAEEAEWAAEEARQKEEHAAEEARWEVERAAEEAQRAEEEARRAEEAARWKAKGDAAKARWEAELAAESAAKQVRTQKVDALMATGMLWLDALQYVDTKPDLDVDALLKQRNEEIAACQRIEALRQMLSEYDFDDCRIDVILNDSEFNPSDLSDLGREKLKVLNHLMHQDHSYKQAIDFVKASNFDAEGFFRAEEEKREAERAEWEAKCAAEEAEEMRQAIETMRTKGLTVEEVNAVLADEDFDPYQYNRHERERLEDELWEKENAREKMLRAKFEEIYPQVKLKYSDDNRARNIASEQVFIQFGSEEDKLNWFDYKKSQMPVDFNWQTYLSSYPDLLDVVDKIGSKEAKEKWAITHYFLHGQYEDRIKYKK